MKKLIFIIAIIFSFYYVSADTNERISQLKLAAQTSQDNLDSIHFEIASLYLEAKAQSEKNLDSAAIHILRAIELSKESSNTRILAPSYLIHAKLLHHSYSYSESNHLLKKSRSLYSNMGDSLGVSKVDLVVAINNIKVGLYTEALELLEGILIRSPLKSEKYFLLSTYNTLSGVYSRLSQIELSEKYLKKALSILDDTDSTIIAGITYNLGTLYLKEKELDSALNYFQKSSVVFKSENNRQGVALSKTGMAQVHQLKGENMMALNYLHSSIEDLEFTGEIEKLNTQYLRIAEIYLELNELKRAEEYIGFVTDYLIGSPNRRLNHELNYLLAKQSAQIEDFEKAYYYQSLYMAEKDSIKREEAIERSREVEAKLTYLEKNNLLETEELSKKLLVKEAQLSQYRQRVYLILGIVLILLISGIAVLVINKKRREKRLLRQDLNKSLNENSELLQEVDIRSRKLSSTTLKMAEKNNHLAEIKQSLLELKENVIDENLEFKINKLEQQISRAQDSEQNWKEFQTYFEEIHQDFFRNIQTKHPDLTSRELRLAALLHLNLSTKEVANLLNLPTKTIEVARYRLKKKLNLAREVNLQKYIRSLS